jgi:hypothetical protein
MCRVVSIACLVLCGCDFSQPANPVSREIIDKSGTNRLALNYVPVGDKSWAFHSLAWRIKAGGTWTNRLVITKSEFEGGSQRNRWVSDIQSLDPSTGNAVIKVAEIGLPQTNGNSIWTPCVYSWREWNLTTNGEIRVLRVCKEPFEPFTGKRFRLFR